MSSGPRQSRRGAVAVLHVRPARRRRSRGWIPYGDDRRRLSRAVPAAGVGRPGMVIATHLIGTPSRRVITGFVLLVVAAIGCLYFALFPGSTPLDRLVEWVLPNESNSRLLHWIVARGIPGALVLGAAFSCVLALFWDRRRAAVCLVAPAVALAITEYVMKPLVGRPVPTGDVHGLAYPSGHMAATAAVVAAAALAVPPCWRKLAFVIGTGVDVSVAICLILLRYHYATDVLGGAAVAIGATLLIDAALHLLPESSLVRTRAASDR